MSKGGGRGSAQQMQQSAFGRGGPQPQPSFGGGIASKSGRSDPYKNSRVYAGGTPNFDEMTGRYRSPPFNPRGGEYFIPPFFPGPEPRPPFFPGPEPRPPGQPSIPVRNTQFQMPSFSQSYGRMDPYRGQFSGYGVPSNIRSFAQPHYQAYAPRSYTPPQETRYTPTAPPTMQLPPGMGTPTFGGGYGGIGGFGRYNLGLAGSQLF